MIKHLFSRDRSLELIFSRNINPAEVRKATRVSTFKNRNIQAVMLVVTNGHGKWSPC